QSASQCRAFLHAAAELRWRVILKSLETDLLQFEPQDDFNCGFLQARVFPERESDVFAHSHRPKQSAALEGHADLSSNLVQLCRGSFRQVLALDQNFPCAG